jgi:1-acyl-sn-glycerol-3-phosphate acyltransferase
MMDFKKGIGMLALRLNVPVVPARVRGTFGVLPRGARFPRPGRIKLAFGKAVEPSSVDLSPRPEGVDEYQFFADELRKRVSETGA